MTNQVQDHILIVDDKVNNIYVLEQLLARADRKLTSVTNFK